MRKLLLFLGMVIILSSCQQQLLNEPESTDATEVTKVKHPGMSRMKFSSREQIQECATLVEQISSKSLLTRALATNTEFTDGDEEFRSLYEEKFLEPLNITGNGVRQEYTSYTKQNNDKFYA